MIRVSHSGEFNSACALLDPVSEGSFVSEKFFNLLRIPSKSINAQVLGLNNGVAARSSKICTLTLCSRFNPVLRLEAITLVLPHLTRKLPSCQLDLASFQSLPDIFLAVSEFYKSSNIEILIGSDLKTLSRFWEIKDIPSKPCSSVAGKYCEEYYTQTTS